MVCIPLVLGVTVVPHPLPSRWNRLWVLKTLSPLALLQVADLVTSLLVTFTWCTLVPVRNLGPLFSTTLALWFVTPAVTAIVFSPLVRVMTLVLPLRHPVPSILRGTFLCPSYPDSSLDPLTETAFISIGRRWSRYLPTRLMTV